MSEEKKCPCIKYILPICIILIVFLPFLICSKMSNKSKKVIEHSFEDKLLVDLKNGEASGYYIFDRIFFSKGSAQISDDSDEQINRVALILRSYPKLKVLLRGHTDNTGDPIFNKQLSLNRAISLRFKFIERKIDPERIKVKGLGSEEPIADNNDAVGREANRRIDISFF